MDKLLSVEDKVEMALRQIYDDMKDNRSVSTIYVSRFLPTEVANTFHTAKRRMQVINFCIYAVVAFLLSDLPQFFNLNKYR